MKTTIQILLLLSVVVCASAFFTPPPPTVYTVEQRVDHFNAGDARTYTQRVLVYSEWYKPGGPIFFTPGGEANARGGYDHNGFMWDHFRDLNALYVFPEHRDYGESPLFGAQSWTNENLRFLTIEQALADYAANIQWARRTFNVTDDAKVVTFGGSYPGELAAFMRIHYPQLVDGALASSAPLLYHPHMVKENAFFEITTHVFDMQEPGCSEIFYKGIEQLQSLMEHGSVDSRRQVQQQLGLCSLPDDVTLLNRWIAAAMADLTMDNYPYPFGGNPAWPMHVSCQQLREATHAGHSPLYALRAAINVDYNMTDSPVACHNVSQEYYPCADLTGCGAPDSTDAISWNYQSCTQIVDSVATLGYRHGDMFAYDPYSFDAVVDYCRTTFDVEPQPLHLLQTYNWTNTTNIIFSAGLIDGWTAGCVLEPANRDQHVILIELAAHHLDLRGADEADPDAVRLARQQERLIIERWLKQ